MRTVDSRLGGVGVGQLPRRRPPWPHPAPDPFFLGHRPRKHDVGKGPLTPPRKGCPWDCGVDCGPLAVECRRAPLIPKASVRARG